MPTIEQAIRYALQRIDATNASMREQIYQKTWQMHEKMLASSAQLTQQQQQKRRENLKNVIYGIEAEFHSAVRPDAATKAQPGTQHDKQQGKEPPLTAGTPLSASRLPAGSVVKNTRGNKKTSSKRLNILLLVLCLILPFVIWFFYNGLLGTSPLSLSDTERTSPSAAGLQNALPSSVRPQSPPRTEPVRQWTRIFDPVDVSLITVQGSAQVQLHEEEGVNFIRISAREREDGVRIDIGSGIIGRLRGKSATFNIMARSVTQVRTQLSVTCDFGLAADCGRWRFELPQTREDLLFNITLPVEGADEGFLLISSNLPGEDNEVDIFSIEVSY